MLCREVSLSWLFWLQSYFPEDLSVPDISLCEGRCYKCPLLVFLCYPLCYYKVKRLYS